jgi:DUF1680 family protein
VQINFDRTPRAPLKIRLRQPSWATDIKIVLNGEPLQSIHRDACDRLAPKRAGWIEVEREWSVGNQLALEFDLPVRVLRMDERVRSCRGQAALAVGPLVYCLESLDNPGVDIFSAAIEFSSCERVFDPALLGGIWVIRATTTHGQPVTLIPYHLWGNRGPSAMTVLCRILQGSA